MLPYWEQMSTPCQVHIIRVKSDIRPRGRHELAQPAQDQQYPLRKKCEADLLAATILLQAKGGRALQLLIERAVQHGLEQMLHALTADGLRGFQFADFADSLGELFLQWQRRNEDHQVTKNF